MVCDRSAGSATIQGLLADPATSFALRRVLRDGEGRDLVDAANDARVLCLLFEREADRRLGKGL